MSLSARMVGVDKLKSRNVLLFVTLLFLVAG